MLPRLDRRPGRLLLWAALILALVFPGCGEFTADPYPVRLRPVLFRDQAAPLLLRPQGIAVDPGDGSIYVVESGRRTLTGLGSSGGVRTRRALRPSDVPPGMTNAAGQDTGAVLVRSATGFWVVEQGLGPLFLPDESGQPQLLLGSGQGGLEPRDGVEVASADLSDVRGLAVDADDHLLVATRDQVFRVLPEGLELVAGRPSDRSDVAGGRDCPLFSFGVTAGLALDGEQNLYLADAGAGLIWRIAPDGAVMAIAGGGERLNPPLEPIDAQQAALDLGRAQLVWDDASGELLLLARNVLYRIGFQEGQPTFDPTRDRITIRTVPATMNLPRGLALGPQGPLVSSLTGVVYLATEEGARRIWQPDPAISVELGWAAAVERVGTSALLIQDSGQRRISLYLPQSGTYLLHAESSPAFNLSAPLAADLRGRVYLITNMGLRFIDVNGPTGLVGLRVGEVVTDGQSVYEVLLPYEGEVRGGENGDLWLLDPGRRFLLQIDTRTGSVTRALGATSGGGLPRDDQTSIPQLVSLTSPSSLAVADSLLLLADRLNPGGGVVYAANLSEQEHEIAGVLVPADRVAHLGGGGSQPYAAGRSFRALALDRVLRLVRWGGGLVVSLEDRFAPPLVRVDAGGLCSEIPIEPRSAPQALVLLEEDLLVAGWSDNRSIMALNLGDQPLVLWGMVIQAGQQAEIAVVESGVVDLAEGASGDLLCWTVEGEIVRFDGEVELLGRTSGTGRALGEATDGGIYLIERGGLWAVDPSGGARFAGEPLPGPGGGLVVEPAEGWVEGTRLRALSFGDNVTSMAIGGDGSLYWTDCETRSLFHAEPGLEGHVEPSAHVELVSRGEPVGAGEEAMILQAGPSGELYLADRERVYRYREGSWERFAGGGAHTCAPGVQAADLLLSDISGMTLDDSLVLRTRQGLIELSLAGEVLERTDLLQAEPWDASLWALCQSLDRVDDRLVIVQAGSVYEVMGWPR
ncbi:MAG: hypothetical protein JW797_00190 [Bradymonadales bacterium]|nr:hypothetical protein [Bradymonadales bacterium]